MKTATLDELKTNVKLLQGAEPIVLKHAGKTLGMLHPLPDPDESIPLKARRRLYLRRTAALRRDLAKKGITEEQIERDIAALFNPRR